MYNPTLEIQKRKKNEDSLIFNVDEYVPFMIFNKTSERIPGFWQMNEADQLESLDSYIEKDQDKDYELADIDWDEE